MNHGPLIFLGVFTALALSWFGLIVGPELQLGNAQPATNVVNTTQLYPQMRPGQARQGLDVYRSLGCASCHTQQIGQTGRQYELVLSEPGTNQTAVIEALVKAQASPAAAQAEQALASLPRTLFTGAARSMFDSLAARLEAAGAKAEVKVVPTGPDISRGWGKRRSVAEDFLYDQPVMLGSQRIGPDLADVGSRRPDAKWHLLHLYSPRATDAKSVMPPYRFLFEKRRVGREPSPDALQPDSAVQPAPGWEIVPSDSARQLVAYLLSLRADTVIFETPMTVTIVSTNAPGATNSPAGAETNAPGK